MRPLFLDPKPVRWGYVLALSGVLTCGLMGGYHLGSKKPSTDLIDALQATCGRSPTIMAFPDGSMAACMPLHQQPEVEQKFHKGLDKDLASVVS